MGKTPLTGQKCNPDWELFLVPDLSQKLHNSGPMCGPSTPACTLSTPPPTPLPVQEHDINVGTWVEVVYDMVTYTWYKKQSLPNPVLETCRRYSSRAYKFEPERYAVWYKREDIVKQCPVFHLWSTLEVFITKFEWN